MRFDRLVTHDRWAEWMFFSGLRQAFIIGGRDWSAAIPVATPASLTSLLPFREPNAHAVSTSVCNLPVPLDLYEEFTTLDQCGFRYLSAQDYDVAIDGQGRPIGNVLLSLIYGHNYGTYMLVSGCGLIVSLKSGSMQLVRRSAAGFEIVAETKTRGRAALAFAAHPTEPLIAYGDNYGEIHVHELSEDAFGKARKVDDLKYKVSQLQFVDAGEGLLAGGMGYLIMYVREKGKYVKSATFETAVREFAYCEPEKTILVNRGIHGVAAIERTASGFSAVGNLDTSKPVGRLSVSPGMDFCAVSAPGEPPVDIFTIHSL